MNISPSCIDVFGYNGTNVANSMHTATAAMYLSQNIPRFFSLHVNNNSAIKSCTINTGR